MTVVPLTYENGEAVDAIEAIDATVEEAFANQLVLKCGTEAQRIAARFPTSGVTVDEIADRLLQTAIEKGVPALLSAPE